MSLPPFLSRLRLPVIGSPLFIISNPQLVIAQCKAGIVGSMPALNARPAEQLDDWLAEITETLTAHDRAHPDLPAAPFAINQIVHKSNDRLERDLVVCAASRCRSSSPASARERTEPGRARLGGLVLHDIINNSFAHKAIERRRWPHRRGRRRGRACGREEPLRLDPEIREWFRRPAGAVGQHCHGRRHPAAQACRADLAYIGSAFIATDEARDRGLQAGHRRGHERRHRLQQPLHRRARQLPAGVHRRGG